jgi:glycosyltransferase involved in cell wall biosynthesis
MRIGIDCRLGGLAHAGIGRYCEQLVFHLVAKSQHTQNICWVLFFFDQAQIDASELFSSVIKNQHVEIVFAPIRHYTVAEQLKMHQIFRSAKLDLLHVPHFNVPILYSRPYVVTIHDLLWHEYQGVRVTTLPKWLYWIKYIGYRFISAVAIKRAKAILVPAETVKSEILKRFAVAENKIYVTYEGVDTKALSANKKPYQTVAISQIPKPFLLYVGSLYPHKNIQVVLQVLASEPDVHLALVGSRNIFQDQVKKQVESLGISDQVHFLGYVPDRNLGELFQQASALVQPSLSEGFGLTGIEAMSMNCPVLASNIPIFREIYGDAAILFDPHSPESLKQGLETLRSLSTKERQNLIKKGQNQINKYDWQKMAAQTYSVYQSST